MINIHANFLKVARAKLSQNVYNTYESTELIEVCVDLSNAISVSSTKCLHINFVLKDGSAKVTGTKVNVSILLNIRLFYR